jgi:hypothetical protein
MAINSDKAEVDMPSENILSSKVKRIKIAERSLVRIFRL